MTNQEIIEGNKLIAEFCEEGYWQIWRINGYKPYYSDQYKTKEEVELKIATSDNGNGVMYMAGKCEPKFITKEYHSSWQWLMPAWIKFYNILNEENLMQRNFPFYGDWYSKITGAIIHGNISEAHKLLSQGIKWYNQNK